MHAVVTLACGLLLCACFDSHDAEAEPAPRKHRDEAGARSPEPSEPEVPQTPDGLDWHAVYFVRRTAPLPGCGAFQVAALGTPEAVRLTIDCWADSNTMTVSPGGAIYFLAQPGPRLQAAKCEEGCREAAATRGVPVDTPACDAERHNPLEQVLMGPDGAVMYACSNGSWHDEQGDLHLEADERYGQGPWHLGRDRLLFTSKYLVDLATGHETEIRGFEDRGAFRIVRSARDGFWVVTWSGYQGYPVLWRIDASGEATRKGEYPRLDGDPDDRNGVLDSDGALYSVSHNGVAARLGSVVRRTISGELRVVLAASEPIAPLFETLITGP